MNRCPYCNTQVSDGKPQLCSRCYWNLPPTNREMYRSGRLSAERAAVSLRLKFASVRAVGGGRKR